MKMVDKCDNFRERAIKERSKDLVPKIKQKNQEQ